jgi:hypothetical protein
VSAVAAQTPRQLFRLLDTGGISREQFREAMALHAKHLIVEMEEVHQNPVAAWLEGLQNKRAAARLMKVHGEILVREVLVALSEIPTFPMATSLWDADRPEIPLHCFFRSSRAPIFRLLSIASASYIFTVRVEYGASDRSTTICEKITFTRDRFGRLMMKERVPV